MKVNSCEKIDELPVCLKELKDKSGVLLNDDQKCLLDSLLKRHINTFSKTKDDSLSTSSRFVKGKRLGCCLIG
jgi:hypothetical protein